MAILSNRYVAAFCVPLGVLVIGVLSKKIMRGRGWQRDDFYLGVELALAALAGDLTYLIDVWSGQQSSHTIAPPIYLVVILVFLFVLIAQHQDWAKQSKSWQQIVYLCFVSNVVGGALLVGFIALVKGVSATP
jgi:hypothetical protein